VFHNLSNKSGNFDGLLIAVLSEQKRSKVAFKDQINFRNIFLLLVSIICRLLGGVNDFDEFWKNNEKNPQLLGENIT
jgi:hypothetical protein